MNVNNVLYCVSQQSEWIETARTMRKRLGWQPTYWLTRHKNHNDIAEAFPEAILHPRLDLNRGLPATDMEGWLRGSLSRTQIEQAHVHVDNAMQILDRIDLGQSLRTLERKRLVHWLLDYTLHVVDKLNLQLAVFSAPPHAIGEYMMYSAMRLRKRECRIFYYTPINQIHILTDAVDALPPQISTLYEERLQRDELPRDTEIQQHLNEIRNADDSFKPWYVQSMSKRASQYETVEAKITLAIEQGRLRETRFTPGSELEDQSGNSILPKRVKDVDNQPLPRAFKLPGRALNAPFLTRREHRLYREWAMAEKIRLKHKYESHCKPINFKQPYIYVPLHYQPERTTCPQGGVFNDQTLVVELLSKALPEGWLLYVKDHPSQFKYTQMGELSRWPTYWDAMADLNSVRFVNTDVSSIKLMDCSQALATVTGAAGWEALVRGTPVLHFGNAWYAPCKGAYFVESAEDIAIALEQIEINPPHTQQEIDIFAGTIESLGRKMSTTPTTMQSINEDLDLADAFTNLLLNYDC